MTNIFEGQINGHNGICKPKKEYIEEMKKQADCI